MKQLTNKLGLPLPLVEAILNDPYHKGHSDYSVTDLLTPPQLLSLKNENNIIEDTSDHLASLEGQALHHILERAAISSGSRYIAEKRYFKTYVFKEEDLLISAQIDLFDTHTKVLSDYKRTSVSQVKKGLKKEWEIQLNVQARLLRNSGEQVKELEIVVILRDWSKEITYEGYPKAPFVKFKVPSWTNEEVDDWIIKSIESHESYPSRECTKEDRWNRSKWAVMKEGIVKAVRVFDTKEEANTYLTSTTNKLIVVERPGEDIRCMRYCPVRSICPQAKKLLQSGEEDDMILVSDKRAKK